MTTFGYEAEFQTNVEDVMERLFAEGLTGSPELHSYHCRCEWCSFDSDYTYRGQHDSSCGGEIISNVFDTGDMDLAQEAMLSLERAAVAVDAEPSLGSGFHVHVGIRGLGARKKDCLWAYLRWEPWLGDAIANARWPGVRDFNIKARAIVPLDVPYILANAALACPSTARDYDYDCDEGVLPIEEVLDGADLALDAVKQYALDWLYNEDDRHLWLNLNTRGRVTWEFRLWNSTRVAWRMELFSRLSALFVNRRALDRLLGVAPSTEAMLAIASEHDDELAGLIDRQVNTPHTNEPFTVMAA